MMRWIFPAILCDELDAIQFQVTLLQRTRCGLKFERSVDDSHAIALGQFVFRRLLSNQHDTISLQATFFHAMTVMRFDFKRFFMQSISCNECDALSFDVRHAPWFRSIFMRFAHCLFTCCSQQPSIPSSLRTTIPVFRIRLLSLPRKKNRYPMNCVQRNNKKKTIRVRCNFRLEFSPFLSFFSFIFFFF